MKAFEYSRLTALHAAGNHWVRTSIVTSGMESFEKRAGRQSCPFRESTIAIHVLLCPASPYVAARLCKVILQDLQPKETPT